MPTPRSLVTLLLLAAVVAVGLLGAANWRSTLQAEPAPVRHASAGRPQVGHSAPPWALGVAQRRGRVPSSAPRAVPVPDVRPAAAYSAHGGAEPARAHAMMLADGTHRADPIRRHEVSPFGGAAQPPGASGGQGAGPAGLATVQFIAVTQELKLLQRDEFLAADVRELRINVWWNVPGPQTQRLDLFSPDGALYRRFSTAFDSAAAQGQTPVETRLPVGGTWITEYSLFGAWRVDVYLGSQPAPITSAYFVLNH